MPPSRSTFGNDTRIVATASSPICSTPVALDLGPERLRQVELAVVVDPPRDVVDVVAAEIDVGRLVVDELDDDDLVSGALGHVRTAGQLRGIRPTVVSAARGEHDEDCGRHHDPTSHGRNQ